MIDQGKKSVLGIMVDAVDYDTALNRIQAAAIERQPFAVSALAVHGVMTGVQNPEHKFRLNAFGLVVPDGQPVRWALNLLHGTSLKSRVYGPELTLRVLAMAEASGIAVYLYGSTRETLDALVASLGQKYPKLIVAGAEPSKFRTITPAERVAVADRIVASGAKITLIGLGCPRQEVFAYEMKSLLSMPLLAVGAAFSFIAGELPQAPPGMQKLGLEWLFRLKEEPTRLWRRYVLLNPYYLFLLAGQWLGLCYSSAGVPPSAEVLYG